MSQKQDALIAELLTLSVKKERSKSLKVRQMAKMAGGKIRKQLRNTEIKHY